MYRLTNSFPYLLNRVGVQMGELFSRRIAGYGVTLPMYRVMAALGTGDQRLGDLAVMTTIEISTLSPWSVNKTAWSRHARAAEGQRPHRCNQPHAEGADTG